MITEKLNSKKFFALQEMVAIVSVFTIGCAIRPELIQLMPLIITVVGIFGAYMGVQGMVDNTAAKK